ncbi:hypothetical protein RJT34_18465 [Clitoria ternatea]|uniref:Uncharacterized protein n=1 Tax=Clitoria ternatea TaxID=43366 RepID=A0AAN9JAV4_CLITE
MAPNFKLLSLIIFIGLFLRGEDAASCTLRDLSISQQGTGNWAHGMPELKVSVTNNCECSQSQVKLNCKGFQTYKAEDPSILSISGDVCLLKSGQPISPKETVQFLYAWDPQFPFQPLSSVSQCH